MASGTFYDAGGPTATSTDSNNRYHQNHLKVTGSSDNEKVTYTLDAYARSGNGSGYYYMSQYSVTVTLYYRLNGGNGISLGSTSGTLNYNDNVAHITESVTINRTTSSQTIQFGAGNTGNSLNNAGHTTGNDTMNALTPYTVSYNANGGTGAPANQIKYYNQNLKLSTTKPTRAQTTSSVIKTTFYTNLPSSIENPPSNTTATVTPFTTYTFNKGYTNTAGTGTSYTPGQTYTANSTLSLYAKGDSVKTNPQVTCKSLSFENYTFHGGSKTPCTPGVYITPSYAPGVSFTPGTNISLYGVGVLNYINPKIISVLSKRCDENGDENEVGTYCETTINGNSGDSNITRIQLNATKNNSTTAVTTAVVVNPTDTNCTVLGGVPPNSTSSENPSGLFDENSTGNIVATIQEITNQEVTHSAFYNDYLSQGFFTMDVLKGGHGIALGKPATETILDIALPTKITNTTTTALNVNGDTTINGTLTLNNYPIDFQNFGNNPIAETANDTVANWVALGSGYAMYNQSILSQQPSQYGILLNFVAPNKFDVFQLWHTQRAGNIFIRGGNTSGGFDYWRDIGGPQYIDGTITRNTNNCSTLGTSWISKKGYVVSVSFIDSKITNALASGSDVVIATLPSGYRPRANRYLQCVEKAGLGVRITASGEVRISNRTGASYAAGSTITFSDSFGAV